jgi:hypothetical protein
MDYKMQQAGGLTDDQFNANSQQSLKRTKLVWNTLECVFQ